MKKTAKEMIDEAMDGNLFEAAEYDISYVKDDGKTPVNVGGVSGFKKKFKNSSDALAAAREKIPPGAKKIRISVVSKGVAKLINIVDA
tara:strand:+ start:514 stop:777 length:264 start_codon:yes stop_codon:yes gene_type:complete